VKEGCPFVPEPEPDWFPKIKHKAHKEHKEKDNRIFRIASGRIIRMVLEFLFLEIQKIL
jgi:hypothetical protein